MGARAAGAGALALLVAAGCGHATKTAHLTCPMRTGPAAYHTSVSRRAGPPATTVTLSGHLPVVDESGRDIGQTARRVDAYWNLSSRKWWTALTRSPLASVPGSPVKFLGTENVARLCTFRLRITIPAVARGRYPIEVLYGDSKGRASFEPVGFSVLPRRGTVSTGPGPGFRPAAGWDLIQNGLSEAGQLSVATAANFPVAPADHPPSSAPTHTVASLPRRGIVIWVQFEPRGFAGDRHSPSARLPLRADEARPSGAPEGFALPARVAVRLLSANAGGYEMYAFLFFGESSPSAPMLAATNRELARLSLPTCPAALPLGRGDLTEAARLTLGWMRRHYPGRARDLRGARAAGRAVPRQRQNPRLAVIRRLCGRRTDRIVAVTVRPDGVGRQALGSELLYFVAKTPRAWVVWREGAT